MTPLNQKIVKLVPEIVEQHSVSCDMDESAGRVLVNGRHHDCELRPITLADVLRAIAITLKDQPIEGGGTASLDVHMSGLFTGNFFDWEYDQVYFWNLSTDLDGQSEECKTFLSKLLGV